jgi:GT2 family glycosyltransferase
VILDYKRIRLTSRFLQSIPKSFKGEILLFSQGNTQSHISKLREIAENDPRISMYVMEQNLGVAVGRNRAFALAKNPWILSLDNDIFFLSNPFSELDKLVRESSAKFYNLSLVLPTGLPYSIGSAMWMWQEHGKIRAGIGSALGVDNHHEAGKFFESTAIMGGSSLINYQEFLRLGGFDENFFIGFDDLRFFYSNIFVWNENFKLNIMLSLS